MKILIIAFVIAFISTTQLQAIEPFNLPQERELVSFTDFFSLGINHLSENIEADLLTVTSDAMNGSLTMKAVTSSDHSLFSLKYLTSRGLNREILLSDLAQGTVLMTESKRDILKLVSTDLRPDQGGNIDLVYLHDGLWNTYDVFPMFLGRLGDQWVFKTRENDRAATKFNNMYLKKKTFFGRVVGIDSISVSLF
jgi:hypothetical protein